MYHIISAVQSLIKEIREVKNKCINVNHVNKEEFKVTTPNPTDIMKKTIKNIKNAILQ
jgi:rRNA maturation endonuclease Nob1